MDNIENPEEPPDKSNENELDLHGKSSKNSDEDCKEWPTVQATSKALDVLPCAGDAGTLESKFSTESLNATCTSINLSNTSFSSMDICSSIPAPSSTSSSSSSSAEQGDFSIASSSSSSFKTSSFDVPPSSLTSRSMLMLSTVHGVASASAVQRRGPGRPRKDGGVPIQRKTQPISGCRPRGRRRQAPGDPIRSQHHQFSGLSMQSIDIPKIGEPAVALISQHMDSQEKDLMELDSDNSLSSAMSAERSISEENFQEHWVGKTCSFCNLGEKSLLGQGEMTRFEPSVGFNPFRKSPKSRRGSSENEKDALVDKNLKSLQGRKQKGRPRERSKSPRRSDDDSNSQPIDELSVIGFADEPDIAVLFEHTGHTNAHHCCAAWSDGVCQTEDYVLINVDKAVVSGITQKCSNCQRLGATIRCRGPKCNKVYHYPCAASSGTFQDIKTMSLLCPQHHHLAPSIDIGPRKCDPHQRQTYIAAIETAETEANCVVCDTPGNISELLFCTSCGHHYHGHCLDPHVAVNAVVRAGWQCPDCKICQTCRQPGDDNKMLVCDTCDKGYHTYCLRPVMTSIPKHGWKCKNCRVCGDCSARTPGSGPSSRWHMNYSVCDSCYQQRNKGLACPLCGRAYRHSVQKEMVQCNSCKKFVHGKCDGELDMTTLQQNKDQELPPDYLCPLCRASPTKGKTCIIRPVESKEITWPPSAGKNLSTSKDDSNVSEGSLLLGSHESLLALNEDSVCSMDIDLQAIERSAQQLQQLSGNSNFAFFDDFATSAMKGFPISASKPLSSLGKLSGKKRIGMGRPKGNSKFVGMKRRAKVAEFGKRRGPKPKSKQFSGVGPLFQASIGECASGKMDEEPGLENKIVLCSMNDEFVLSQDMCIMCGSYGQGEEGRLISCSQCGQCYHPYCVSIKVTKVLLTKGWRCLDCTVCEGCGQPHDEGRLLLCDDCDISYHIYCLDPPLEQVPQGNWKCKWCVVCHLCGATDPGHNAEWQSNYTQCGPCSSLAVCPVCRTNYKDDELIIQCIECDRWLHAACDEMKSEDDAEICADYGYHCLLCRPKDEVPPHLLPPPPPPPLPPPKPVEPPKPPTPPIQKPPPEPVVVKVKPQPQFVVDGVQLSESGMHQIKSLILEPPKKTRARRNKPAPLPKHLPTDSRMDLRLSEDTEDMKSLSLDALLDQSNEGDKLETPEEDLGKDIPAPEENPPGKKKRQRNLQKLGVGGFVVRSRGRANLHRELDKGEILFSEQTESSHTLNEGSLAATSTEIAEKPRKKRKIKKKSQLRDNYPSYLQEAFFGKMLLDTSKEQQTFSAMSEDRSPSPVTLALPESKPVSVIAEEKTPIPEPTIIQPDFLETSKASSKTTDDEDLGDSEVLKDILPLAQDLPQDDELVKMLMNESDDLTKHEGLEDITESNIVGDDASQEVDASSSKDDTLNKDDPLTDILSPHFNLDTMVGDTGTCLPQMDGKEVEDLFKGVFTDDVAESLATATESTFSISTNAIPQAPATTIQAPVQRPPLPTTLRMSSPFSVPPPSPYPSEYSSSPQFSPGFSEPPPSPWVPPEPDVESPSYNQRSVLKWESDEVLGSNATISAVLYANVNHPDLKNDYPTWTDRAKQIAKIWRGLPSEKRTQYVQKARENRAACRIQKAQQMKESGNSATTNVTIPKQGKRPKQGTTPPEPPPEPPEVIATPNSPRRPPIHEKEQDRIVREQKAQREQEQERQWKHLQTLRQHQAQQQQQILQEQRAQVVPTQPNPLPTLPAMARMQQQQIIGGEQLRGPVGQTSGGPSTPTTPTSPGQLDVYASMPGTPMPCSQPTPDVLVAQQPHVPHPSLVHEAQLHPRAMPGQLNVATPQVQAVAPPLSPHSLQSPPAGISKLGGPFTPPIQVSRVRPPIDPTQMHPSIRMQCADPYAQMPGTPRPSTGHGQEHFIRPHIQHRQMSPQIGRPTVRLPDTYARQPFTPRPQQPLEMYCNQPPPVPNTKPHMATDIYAKQPMTPRPPSQDSLGPPTPRSQDVFHTPPSTPHPQPPTPEAYVQPRTPVSEPFLQQGMIPRPAQSPFSPPQTPHSTVEGFNKHLDGFNKPLQSHVQMSPDSFGAPLQAQRVAHQQDPYAQQPQTPRPVLQQESFVHSSPALRPQLQSQEQYVQSPRTPCPQEPFTSPVGTPRPRMKPSPVDPFSQSSSSPHQVSPVCDSVSTPLQHSQNVEHFSQPCTPTTPCPSLSPMEDPYAQPPITPRSHPPALSPVSGSGRRSIESFPVTGHLDGESTIPEQLLRVGGMNTSSTVMEPERAQLMARQQLRDLLQKQQMKKHIEQHMREQQSQMPLRHWPLEQGSETIDNVSALQNQLQPQASMEGPEGIRPGNSQLVRPLLEMQRHGLTGVGTRMIPMDSGFRQPYPPNMRPRMNIQSAVIAPGQNAGVQSPHGQPQTMMGQFPHSGQGQDPRLQGIAANDPQIRMALLQQQRLAHPGQLRVAGPRMATGFQNSQGNNPMDPYGHLVHVQQQQQLQQHRMPQQTQAMVAQIRQGQMGIPQESPTKMGVFGQPMLGQLQGHQLPQGMIRQGLIGPRISSSNVGMQPHPANLMNYNVSTTESVLVSHNPSAIPRQSPQQIGNIVQPQIQDHHITRTGMSEHDQLLTTDLDADIDNPANTDIPDVPLQGDATTADNVAEELRKIEKESQEPSDQKVAEPEDDFDDDELLGLGNDFNILEYADPELDKDIVGDGKKTNILDENLDLDDKDEDLDEEEEKSKIGSPDKVSIIKRELEENPQSGHLIPKTEPSEVASKQQASNTTALRPTTDFQAKFLEFSKRRDIEKAEELKNSDIFEDEHPDTGLGGKSEERESKGKLVENLNRTGCKNMPSASTPSGLPVPGMMRGVAQRIMRPYVPQEASAHNPHTVMPMHQRPQIGQFGQSPMTMSPELHQQLPLGPQQPRLVQPPPYQAVVSRPPPPYQAMANVRAQLHPRAYSGKPMIGISGHGPAPQLVNAVPPHIMSPNVSQHRSLHAPEQRLLLEDLVEQEKKEQQKLHLSQNSGLLSPNGLLQQPFVDDSLLGEIDLEKLKADVLGTTGAVSMSPPGPAVPAQGMLPLQPTIPGSPSLRTTSPSQGPLQNTGLSVMGLGHPDNVHGLGFQGRANIPPQSNIGKLGTRLVTPQDPGIHPALMLTPRHPFPMASLPPPPIPPAELVTEADRQQYTQYEHWLLQQQRYLTTQQKYFETEVGKLRKTRKSLNTKQRNLRKTGQSLAENDSRELERITREQTGLQKQLDQFRKQLRQHTMVMQEFQTKQQKRQQQISLQQSSLCPPQSPMMSGPSTPMSPLMSPSPIGPSPSPLRQQSPSPMMQHSPLGPAPSPLMQHSPHGQPGFQQSSPRMQTPTHEQQVMRPSGLQVSQEDNNPFSESFQHRELRPQLIGRQLHHQQNPGLSPLDESEDCKSALQQVTCYREESGQFSATANPNWSQASRPTCSLPNDSNTKQMPRFIQGVGQRMLTSLGVELQQQQQHHHQRHYSGGPTASLEMGSPQGNPSGGAPHSSPAHHVGQSPTHFQPQSPSCSQTERNITTPVGNRIQTPSPSLSMISQIDSTNSASINAHGNQPGSHAGFQHLQQNTHQHGQQQSVPGSPHILSHLAMQDMLSERAKPTMVQDGSTGSPRGYVSSAQSPEGHGMLPGRLRKQSNVENTSKDVLTGSRNEFDQDDANNMCPLSNPRQLITGSVSDNSERPTSSDNLKPNETNHQNLASSLTGRGSSHFGSETHMQSTLMAHPGHSPHSTVSVSAGSHLQTIAASLASTTYTVSSQIMNNFPNVRGQGFVGSNIRPGNPGGSHDFGNSRLSLNLFAGNSPSHVGYGSSSGNQLNADSLEDSHSSVNINPHNQENLKAGGNFSTPGSPMDRPAASPMDRPAASPHQHPGHPHVIGNPRGGNNHPSPMTIHSNDNHQNPGHALSGSGSPHNPGNHIVAIPGNPHAGPRPNSGNPYSGGHPHNHGNLVNPHNAASSHGAGNLYQAEHPGNPNGGDNSQNQGNPQANSRRVHGNLPGGSIDAIRHIIGTSSICSALSIPSCSVKNTKQRNVPHKVKRIDNDQHNLEFCYYKPLTCEEKRSLALSFTALRGMKNGLKSHTITRYALKDDESSQCQDEENRSKLLSKNNLNNNGDYQDVLESSDCALVSGTDECNFRCTEINNIKHLAFRNHRKSEESFSSDDKDNVCNPGSSGVIPLNSGSSDDVPHNPNNHGNSSHDLDDIGRDPHYVNMLKLGNFEDDQPESNGWNPQHQPGKNGIIPHNPGNTEDIPLGPESRETIETNFSTFNGTKIGLHKKEVNGKINDKTHRAHLNFDDFTFDHENDEDGSCKLHSHCPVAIAGSSETSENSESDICNMEINEDIPHDPGTIEIYSNFPRPIGDSGSVDKSQFNYSIGGSISRFSYERQDISGIVEDTPLLPVDTIYDEINGGSISKNPSSSLVVPFTTLGTDGSTSESSSTNDGNSQNNEGNSQSSGSSGGDSEHCGNNGDSTQVPGNSGNNPQNPGDNGDNPNNPGNNGDNPHYPGKNRDSAHNPNDEENIASNEANPGSGGNDSQNSSNDNSGNQNNPDKIEDNRHDSGHSENQEQRFVESRCTHQSPGGKENCSQTTETGDGVSHHFTSISSEHNDNVNFGMSSSSIDINEGNQKNLEINEDCFQNRTSPKPESLGNRHENSENNRDDSANPGNNGRPPPNPRFDGSNRQNSDNSWTSKNVGTDKNTRFSNSDGNKYDPSDRGMSSESYEKTTNDPAKNCDSPSNSGNEEKSEKFNLQNSNYILMQETSKDNSKNLGKCRVGSNPEAVGSDVDHFRRQRNVSLDHAEVNNPCNQEIAESSHRDTIKREEGVHIPYDVPRNVQERRNTNSAEACVKLEGKLVTSQNITDIGSSSLSTNVAAPEALRSSIECPTTPVNPNSIRQSESQQFLDSANRRLYGAQSTEITSFPLSHFGSNSNYPAILKNPTDTPNPQAPERDGIVLCHGTDVKEQQSVLSGAAQLPDYVTNRQTSGDVMLKSYSFSGSLSQQHLEAPAKLLESTSADSQSFEQHGTARKSPQIANTSEKPSTENSSNYQNLQSPRSFIYSPNLSLGDNLDLGSPKHPSGIPIQRRQTSDNATILIPDSNSRSSAHPSPTDLQSLLEDFGRASQTIESPQSSTTENVPSTQSFSNFQSAMSHSIFPRSMPVTSTTQIGSENVYARQLGALPNERIGYAGVQPPTGGYGSPAVCMAHVITSLSQDPRYSQPSSAANVSSTYVVSNISQAGAPRVAYAVGARPGGMMVRMPLSMAHRQSLSTQVMTTPSQRPDVQQSFSPQFRGMATNQNFVSQANLRLAIARGMQLPGNQRFAVNEQVGQPPIQLPPRHIVNLQRPGAPFGPRQLPVNSTVKPMQGVGNRCAFLPSVLRVSQVGLPNSSVSSSPNSIPQYPPSSSPHTIPSSAATSFSSTQDSSATAGHSYLPSPVPAISPSSSSSHSTDALTKEQAKVEIKLESMESPDCLLSIKQEVKSDIIKGDNKGNVNIVTKSGDTPFTSCAFARGQPPVGISTISRSSCTAETKKVAQDNKAPVAFGDRRTPDNQEGTPQNALLKQLLQTCQPQSNPSLPKKLANECNLDVPTTSTTTDQQLSRFGMNIKILSTPEKGRPDEASSAEKPLDERILFDTRQLQGNEESAKPANKRKQSGQPKRQPKPKANKDGAPPKKRPRKGSSAKPPEETYDSYMEATMVQLCALPALRILEPAVQTSFNVCPAFGSGNLNSSDSKIKGSYGNSAYQNHADFYSTAPFGDHPPTPAVSLPPTPPPQRGFYNQEFPSHSRGTNFEHGITIGPDPRRTVEIPSCIPTPPPYLDKLGREVGSPDTIISSSSPECAIFDAPYKYPGLRLIEVDSSKEDNDTSSSPIIPLFAPIPIRARPLFIEEKLKEIYEFDDDDLSTKDKENLSIGQYRTEKEVMMLKSKLGIAPPSPLKDSGNVAITLTLTSTAAEDIRGVLSAVADLLKIPIPLSFEITERTTTPPSQKLGLYKKGRDLSTNIHSIINGQPRFCRHCDVVVLNAGIRKKLSELPFLIKDEQEEDEIIFCSTNCYYQFALTHRTLDAAADKETATVFDRINLFGPIRPRLQESKSPTRVSPTLKEKSTISADQISNKNIDDKHDKSSLTKDDGDSDDNAKSVESTAIKKEPPSPKDATIGSSIARVRKLSESSKDSDVSDEPLLKKWRELRWKHFSVNSLPAGKFSKSADEDIGQVMDRTQICIRPKKLPADSRACVLCLETGDGLTDGAARLLNMDVDKWIHLNCALWSAEVYETVNGALMNVENALRRGLLLECGACHRKGATLGCFRVRCTNVYHFTCAIKEKCMFFKDKTMLCPVHIPKQLPPEIKENELQSLAVFRRVYINRDENRQVASVMHRADQNFLLRVGSLIFLSIGQLLPHQLQAFHNSSFIYPVGYKIIRMYWSMRHIGKRCQYVCTIQDSDGRPEFRIHVKEPGHSDVVLSDSSPRAVWQQVLEPIDRMRRQVNAIKVFTAFITGEDLYGLNEPSILRVIESLPGVESLVDYNFKYGRSPLLELPLAINPTGSARTEPKLRTHFKRPHTLHTSSSSRSSFQTAITGLEAACPYTKQFVHSKSSQYRKMKVDWRNNVYLARSRIQGLGLYAAREIEKHTMVIEYIGLLIRNEVSELRESFYEAQNQHIYMFRLDEGRVIDATMSGGLARYINHSCNPNCVAEVVQIDRDNRIIIFANRRISRGEELTYDYKFDIEDDQHKIPCLCGASNCKKWMN